jgi:hypothetical protein
VVVDDFDVVLVGVQRVRRRGALTVLAVAAG